MCIFHVVLPLPTLVFVSRSVKTLVTYIAFLVCNCVLFAFSLVFVASYVRGSVVCSTVFRFRAHTCFSKFQAILFIFRPIQPALSGCAVDFVTLAWF